MAIYCVYISRPSHFTAWIYAIKSALPTPPAPYPSLQDRHAQALALVADICLARHHRPDAGHTTRRGGPVPGGLPLPRPALLLRSPTTDLATLIDAPFDYRKRRRVP